jgi:hypothetical protein
MHWGWGTHPQMTFWDTQYLKLHTYGMNLMHAIITECVMGRIFTVKNKLYNILLSVETVNHKRDAPFTDTPSAPASTLNNHPDRKLGLELVHSGPLLSMRVYSTSHKSILCQLLLCILYKALFSPLKTWHFNNWEILRPIWPVVPFEMK